MAIRKTQAELEKRQRAENNGYCGLRAAYYRDNPQRYVSEVLGITLKIFQKILLWCMMHYNFTMYLAARGQGKTYLTALFCCVRCILFPGTKNSCKFWYIKTGK